MLQIHIFYLDFDNRLIDVEMDLVIRHRNQQQYETINYYYNDFKSMKRSALSIISY